ncbi:hypothetical protein [Desulfosporosinus youngiae]|uniref:Uncharacterized protein n=1 Tax=Desulfosporosinus youngiae DSM 17734 TaxID=768710 RepID=H5Y593_9FIRM|nr:hypothetical protein [Desulfosporosinus youngiae]EHQ90197.1 hypothetical protein DesyoDRAFT_3163 [Desulfosporosinus youngiae DSM 17734]
MRANLLSILSNFTVEEIEFLIEYHNALGMINNMEEIMKIKEREEKLSGLTWAIFSSNLEASHKESIVEDFIKKNISERDFFLLTIAICEENPEVASYISTPYGC